MCIFCILKELEVNVSRPSLGYDFGGQQVFDESCEYQHFVARSLLKLQLWLKYWDRGLFKGLLKKKKTYLRFMVFFIGSLGVLVLF